MSTLNDKISEALTEPVVPLPPLEYLHAAWALLIGTGGVLDIEEEDFGLYGSGFSYYGNRLEVSRVLTVEALTKIREVGIDFSQCTDPVRYLGQGFAGTFTDHNEDLYAIMGKMVLNDGTVYIWGTQTEEDLKFSRLVSILLEQVSIEDGLSQLEDRLTHPKIDDWTFAYTARLPADKYLS